MDDDLLLVIRVTARKWPFSWNKRKTFRPMLSPHRPPIDRCVGFYFLMHNKLVTSIFAQHFFLSSPKQFIKSVEHAHCRAQSKHGEKTTEKIINFIQSVWLNVNETRKNTNKRGELVNTLTANRNVCVQFIYSEKKQQWMNICVMYVRVLHTIVVNLGCEIMKSLKCE